MLPRRDWLRIAAAIAACSVVVAALFASPSGGQSPVKTPPNDLEAFQKTVQPFLAKHCLECHGEKKQSGDVRLDLFQDATALAQGYPTLEKAEAMLRKHVMPPQKRPQPGDDESKPVLAWLDGFITRMDALSSNNPGRVVIRRLNRTEYNNSVRDLLGVVLQPADDFPPDDSGYGFDNIGSVLSLSPVLMEKYLDAAETVARTALFGPPLMKVSRVTHEPWYIDFSTSRSVKVEYDETGMSLPQSIHVIHRFPVDAEYDLRAILRGFRPNGSNPVEVGFWIDGKMVKEMKVTVPKGGELNGLWAEFRMPVAAGDHWLSATMLRLYEGLPPAYKGPNPAKTTAGIGQASDGNLISNIFVTGPYAQAKGPSSESLKKIFTCGPTEGPHDPACAAKILADLARRAYRRPPTAKEVDDLVKLVAIVQKEGDSFEEGLCVAIQRILISPHFLFRVERTPPPEDGNESLLVSQHELATRLSYFLWSSLPDEELLTMADKQKLRENGVLETQVRRMLKDPKSDRFARDFGGQWLQTRALETHTPERPKFQQFTEYTRMSMMKETELFFQYILREDRSVLDFIDADYTFLNQRLAEFYKILGVKGHEFRKVALNGPQRGGVWTHASVLTVSSYANRTSPVLRGKWILENLLNAPPPPPPADVPNLEDAAVGKSVTLREQMEMHRASPACASCHARMDPLGFALENFDAIGSWRDKDGKFAIDASGETPYGKTFKGPEGLREILKSDPSAFAECLAEKMLIYALGRGLERYDRHTVKTIAQRMAKDQYRFSSLVLGIVESTPFQMRKTSGAKQ
jgi:hypothetical protein